MRPNPGGIQLEMENPKVTRTGDGASDNDQWKDERITRGDLKSWDHMDPYSTGDSNGWLLRSQQRP